MTKEEVDHYSPELGIPSYQLLAYSVNQSIKEPLQYPIELKGAKSPNILTLYIEGITKLMEMWLSHYGAESKVSTQLFRDQKA